MDRQPQSADVIVIGGGITGVSALYYLARAGIQGLLLERQVLGAGSTSKAAGGIRAQFSDELNVQIMVEAKKRFENFGVDPGHEIDFKQWGYLFLLPESEVGNYEARAAMQKSFGVPVEILDPDEAGRIVPGLNLDGVAAAAYCPTDGYATPEAVVQGYAAGARRSGATIKLDTAVREISVTGGKVTGVVTDHGPIAAASVIVACGVWSNELLEPIGIHLPIVAEKRSVFLSVPGDPLPHQLPLTIDVGTGFYFHREGEGLLIAGRHFLLEDLAPHAMRRLPFLADLGIRPGWTGYYAVTPDHNPIIEEADQAEGLAYATGFSGHGFMQGPVVGEYLAGLVTKQPAAVDLSPFSSHRFVTGRLKPELNVI